ncbi:hypothetical protein [Streptomyces sp. SID13031]|uniref:hypothetical protein n=1 Tax=Streptomyces sp. SID13031 TaxID=2706046 RepID=UPI0013CA1379|nr:hypothetical protein [Streptomyces sp. SID13031]NEA34395.1 hypothetical protein [Streptomyces sp. SID13031]
MTAHNPPDEPQDQPTSTDSSGADPLGPINLPSRSRIGRRAFALVGYTSTLAVGLMVYTDCPITTSVSKP